MTDRKRHIPRFSVFRSTPWRLALAFVLLFSTVSLTSFAASFFVTQSSLKQALKEELVQDMSGFRATPSATALATLVRAQSVDMDPERMVLSYLAPTLQHFGNAALTRDSEGYQIFSADISGGFNAEPIQGRYLALTETLHGGRLTIARSYQQIEGLQRIFTNIFLLSLVPTILIGLSGGMFLARRSNRQVQSIHKTLQALTGGNLTCRVETAPNWAHDFRQIALDIDRMAEAQKVTFDSLRQVSSDIAHDLKTPIQRVATYLETIEEDQDLPPETRELLDKARSELANTVTIFHAFLELAQIEAGVPESRFKAVDTVSLLTTLYEVYEPEALAMGKSLQLELPPPTVRAPNIFGDTTLLGQALSNLLVNAIRHTPEGTKISLALAATPEAVEICVSDNGWGIPQEEHEAVFQRLYRLDRSRSSAGNGLGLSLVKGIATLHGAKIILTNNDPGLCVKLTFARYEVD